MSAIPVPAYLVPGHKHVAGHRACRLVHLVVGQPNDPVDLTQPEAGGEKDAKGGSHGPVSDRSLRDVVVQTQFKQTERNFMFTFFR